jgi:hypothetical protein
MKTATLPQEDWDLILNLLRGHSDRFKEKIEEDDFCGFYLEVITNAAAETDDLYFRIEQQVSND